ncbi:hypothetical protein [Vibrio anguillarum]|uniref:hypothetical protein n=1 Tax=Vibrio anguillarum TaxID=55601 RepID=UPI0030EEB9D9
MLKSCHLVLCFMFISLFCIGIWNANVAIWIPKEYVNYCVLLIGSIYALLGGYLEHKPQGSKRLRTYQFSIVGIVIVTLLLSLYKDINAVIGLGCFVVGFLDCNRKYEHFS